MSEMTKNKQLTMTLAILLAVAEALFITVKLSSEGTGKAQDRVSVEINERLAKLEECVSPMRGLPQQVAGVLEAVRGLQAGQNRLEEGQVRVEKKVDSHIAERR